MSNSTAINIVLNPVIDIAKFNQIVSTMKSAFVDLNPIDGKKLTATLSSIKPSFVGLNTEAKGLADEISKAASNTKGLGDNASLASKAFDFNNMINAVSNITGAFSQITQVGIDFEDSLAAVSAITGFTGDKLDVLGVSARNLAKEFGGSATDQLTSFQGILSKLGPEMANDSEALATYAKNVNILSKASGDDAATSMSALTDSLLQMGLASGTPAQIANESTKAINILAASAQVGAAEIPQVAQALLASGVAAKGANMSLVDVNAAIQVLAVGGKTGAEAGTALRNVLGLMQKASGPAEAAMGKLGTSSKELGKILTTQGLDVALAKLNEGMNKVGTDAEKNAIMMEIFGTENAAAAGIMMQNTDKFAAFSKGIEAGMQGQGAAFEQAGIRMNTAGQMIGKVQAYVSDAFIGITQSIGQGATALIGASAQFAPLITSFAGLGSLIPEGMFSNAVSSLKSFGTTIISSVIPGLVTQNAATGALIFNTEMLSAANIKKRAGDLLDIASAKAKMVWDSLSNKVRQQSIATNEMLSLSNLKERASSLLSSAASTIKITTTNLIVAAKERLIIMQNSVSASNMKERVSELLSSAATSIKAGATWALTTASQGLLAVKNALTLANIKDVAMSAVSTAWTIAKTVAMSPLIAAQLAYNAALSANPIGLVIAGAVALGGALYLLYDNVEAVRNVFDGAWNVITVGAETAWEVIKAGASVVGEIGSMVYEFITIPFQLTWSVISGIGGAIGSLIGSLLGVSDTGNMLQSVFIGIQQAGQILINVFDTVKATIAGLTGAVSAVMDSVSESISKVFSLDFSGAWDSFTGAGDKAAQAFNDQFNDKMRTAKFEEAAKSIEKGLESAKDIEVKVKAKTDFQDTLKSYEEVQGKIDALSSKPKSSLTANQVKELEDLKLKAAEYSTQIQKVAPATVNSMSAIVGLNGQLTTSYDINIAKAKEFGSANDYTQTLNNQKQAVSKSISDMTTNYASQEDVVKKMKKELEKPITNKEEYAKLQTSFTEASKKAEEMKTQLVDNFQKAGQAGMLTETAISKVAKSLGVTNSQAKNMLLTKELEKVSNQSELTKTQISEMASKYGLAKDEVSRIFAEQKKVTAEIENSKKATEGWADASKRIKESDAAADTQIRNAKLQLKNNKDLSAAEKERLQLVIKTGEETKKNLRDEAKSLVAVDKEMKNNAKYAEVETTWKKEETKEKKSQYEIDKESLATLKDKQKREEDGFISSQERNRKEQGFIETENSKLNDKIAKNQRVLDDYKAQQDTLDKMLIDANKLSDKDGKRTQAVNDTKKAMADLNFEIEKVGNENKGIEFDVKLNDAEQKKAFEKLKLDAQSLELEGKIKLGLISETQKVKIEIDRIELDKAGINEAIQKVESELSKDTENQELKNKIQGYKNDLLKLNNDLDVKNAEYLDKTSRDRISSIADTAARERELKIYELEKTYNEELYLAQGNAQKKLVISQAYADNRNKIEQDYLAKTSFSYNALTKLSTAFANIKVGSVDRSEIVNLNKTKSDLSKERQELENSYAVGKTDYESYQKSLSDIQNKESDNRIAIEQAEAERRKAIWSGFTTAVSGYFGTMYDEYSKKASESVNAVTTTHQLEYERKRDLAIAEKALKYATETDNYTMQFAMSVKRQELQNQEASSTKAATDATAEAYANLAVMSSAYLGQMLVEQKNTLKALAMAAFSALKGMAAIYMADITAKALAQPDSVATFGSTGIGRAAIIGALLYGAIGVAENVVMGAFRDGVVNFQGKGNSTSDSNLVKISHGESVMTAKATANPINKKFFSHANKGGDLVSFLQTDKDVQRQLAQQRIMQSYESVSRQKEMFDRIVADYNNTNKQLKEQNKELVNEIRTMKNELVEVFRTNIKIENHQNWKLNVENKVVKAVEQLDLSGR